jgi:hypothetical protein
MKGAPPPMKQQVNIKFCLKLGKTAAETREMLETVYGNEAVFHMLVFSLLNIQRGT